MKYSHQSGFSIVLALGLTLLLSLTGLYLLEYVVPFSRNVKGIESASNSFYQAYAGLEQSMYFHSQNTIGYQTGTSLSGSKQEDFSYNIGATGTGSPLSGNGSSEYNRDFNKLSQAEPAQFVIGNGRFPGATKTLTLQLQVPNISPSSVDAITTASGVVLWQLSSSGASLTSTNLITGTQINNGYSQNLFGPTTSGTTLNGTAQGFTAFYNAHCNAVGAECVLKISLVSPIFNTISGNPRIPYLEYKIESNRSIPLREALITTQGKSYGFRRSLEVLVPQTTTNSAFDFTVFQ